MEEFKIIKDFDNYEVSNFGNVRNNQTGHILKPGINTQGYYFVNLYKDGKIKTKRIHRLVGEAFIPNQLNKPLIDHINNLRTDNRVENLRWATTQENAFNQQLSSANTSGSKGVYYHKRDKVWYAKIQINGQKLHLGNFDSKEEAIKARVKKAKQLFGEYLNACEQIKVEVKEEIQIKQKEIYKKQRELEELEALDRELDEILNC